MEPVTSANMAVGIRCQIDLKTNTSRHHAVAHVEQKAQWRRRACGGRRRGRPLPEDLQAQVREIPAQVTCLQVVPLSRQWILSAVPAPPSIDDDRRKDDDLKNVVHRDV